MFVILFVALMLLSTFLYLSFSRHYRLRTFGKTRIIPGDQPDWVLGNIRHMGLLRGVPVYRGHLAYQQKFGDVWQYFLGNSHQLVFVRPEHAQHILSKRAVYEQADFIVERLSLMVPHAIISVSGSDHRRHVRAMLPMLKKARAVEFVPLMSDHMDMLLEQWEQAYKQQQEQDGTDPNIKTGLKHTHILKHMQIVTLEIIGHIAYSQQFGTIHTAYQDFQTQTTSNQRHQKHIKITTLKEATALLVDRFTSVTNSGLPPWLQKIVLKFDQPWQQARALIKCYVEKQVDESGSVESKSAAESINLLSRLVGVLSRDGTTKPSDESNLLTREEVLDDLFAIILGGYETMATVLSWFIVYVSRNPDVQERIKEEIRKVIPKQQDGKPPPISQTQLDELLYMDAVVKETLRLSPTAQSISRVALCDDVIDGIEIKAGQEVTIPMINMHLDPRFWKIDPLKFCPDRFFGENAPDKDHHPYALLPFGGGAHGCSGQDLARVELKVLMTRLMQRVTFHDTPDNLATEVLRFGCVPTNVCVGVTWD